MPLLGRTQSSADNQHPLNSSMTLPDHQKRMRRRETPGEARFVTFSCYKQLPLFQNDQIKQVFADRLARVRETHRCQLLAWVLMPEHVHLVLVPNLPEHPLKDVLSTLKRPIAEQVIRRWREFDASIRKRLVDRKGRIRFWQRGGGYDRNIVSDQELLEKINYIHDNPVRRGLADRTVDWPWSSACWYETGEGLISMDAWD